jgi:hypothetical protein
MSDNKDQFSGNLPFAVFNSAMDYMVDAGQRTLLFWDVMRQRGRQYEEHLEEAVPNVLNYQSELVLDGRTLDRPVNYGLVRIVPPEGVEVDPKRRPFVVIDPRAGHGPGDRRFQGRQRDRRRTEGRSSLLFRRLHAGADAGPDH